MGWQFLAIEESGTKEMLKDVWAIGASNFNVQMAPHISIGNPQLGIYSLSDNQLALVADGKVRLIVDSNGVSAELRQENWHDAEFEAGWQHMDEQQSNLDLEHVGYFKIVRELST